MKNINLKSAVIGEARFVFEVGETAPVTTQKPSAETAPAAPPENPTQSALAGLMAETGDAAKAEASGTLEEPIDFDKLGNDPNKLGDVMERLAAAWDKGWEAFYALFAPMGLKAGDVDAALNTPGKAREDTKEPEPPGFEKENGAKMTWKDWKSMEHAALALEKNPTWLDYIKETSNKYDIPVSTLVAMLEMESGFNPNARPGINPKTGKPESAALGLAQGMPSAITNYKQQTGNPHADLSNPATAIDFMGFHITQGVRNVNRLIETSAATAGFKSEYRLTSRSEVKYLHMTYNNGELGYLVLRRYMDNPTEENFDRLTFFQKRERGKHKDGSVLYEWEQRAAYSERVGNVARIYDGVQEEVKTLVAFQSPPIPGDIKITSHFGPRIHPTVKPPTEQFHNGIDISAAQGTPVLAVRDGKITGAVTGDPINGNYITVTHDDGSTSQYLHLSQINVSVGPQVVAAGTQIGAVGSTGRSSGAHLHFIYKGPDGIPRNPESAVA